MAGAAVVAGGSATAAAQKRAPDEVAEGRKTGTRRDPKKTREKNKEKKDGGWCTEDLYFDQEGCLFIANAELAHAIVDSLNAWGGRLCMSREAFAGETGPDGGPIEGGKVNMLCPC
jgi:hypothetical protein